MASPRFTPRLRLALFLPTLIALFVAMPLIWALTNGLIRRGAETHLGNTLTIVEVALADVLDQPDATIQRRVQALAGGTDARITVIAADGRVLADSERSLEQIAAMDDHTTRPEISAAKVDGFASAVRRSATLDRDFLYVASRLSPDSGSEGYLRLAEPLAASETLRRRLAVCLLLASSAALLAMTLISLWLDRELFKPLRQLVGGATRLADGELEHRVDVPRSEEIGALAQTLNQLAGSVRHQIERAAAERERLQLIGDSMADGLLVTDAAGRVTTVNPALRRMFRVRGSVAGRSLRDVTGLAKLKKAVKRSLATATSQSFEVETPGPRPRTLSVRCSALQDRSGGVVAIRDISEFLLLGEIRRDLVANVSHELKTPLTAIRGYAETLVDGALEDEDTALRFTERILQQCARLQALLDDLLTLSRLESDDDHRQIGRVDLKQIVDEAVEVLEATAESRKVEITVTTAEVTLAGDHEALSELCINLIDNAIKYNRDGGSVSVRLSQADGWAELEVGDSGQGIPQDAIPRIFERFYRVDRGRSRGEGGTGLGLAIAKHAVEGHDGEVVVESTLGKGSTFRVRLPIKPLQSE